MIQLLKQSNWMLQNHEDLSLISGKYMCMCVFKKQRKNSKWEQSADLCLKSYHCEDGGQWVSAKPRLVDRRRLRTEEQYLKLSSGLHMHEQIHAPAYIYEHPICITCIYMCSPTPCPKQKQKDVTQTSDQETLCFNNDTEWSFLSPPRLPWSLDF